MKSRKLLWERGENTGRWGRWLHGRAAGVKALL